MFEVVVPLYNEEENVPELFRRLRQSCDQTKRPYQVTFVDDGSRDSTVSLLKHEIAGDTRFHIIELSRNFGHQAAISAGLRYVQADAVVLLDGDLQDPPELIPDLVNAWENGSEVVIARRTSRQESGIRRVGFETFHRFFKYLIDVPIPPHTGTFCLMNREALDAINNMPEVHRFFPGLRAWVGFHQTFVDYDRHERWKGSPKQAIPSLFRYASDGVLSFSFKPLRLMTYIGFVICGVAFLTATAFLVKRLIGVEDAPLGFTTLSCAIFGLGGIQLIGMGILGEYVGRIYEESKQRGLFVIKQSSLRSKTIKKPNQRIAA